MSIVTGESARLWLRITRLISDRSALDDEIAHVLRLMSEAGTFDDPASVIEMRDVLERLASKAAIADALVRPATEDGPKENIHQFVCTD